MVSTPNAPASERQALLPLLEQAGAVVSGVVALRPDLLDPERADAVGSVVDRLAPPELGLAGPPLARAATELAAALLTSPMSSALTATQADQVLAGLAEADLVDLTDTSARADLAVVLTGDPVASADPAVPAARAAAVLTLAEALDAAGEGAVLAGPLDATQDGGVLRALRDDGRLSERISSVDGTDRAAGRVATVLALREQALGGAGRYGSAPGAQAAAPSPPAS